MFKKIILKSIVFYQKSISPIKKPCCRFTPTCSEYAYEAVLKFGVWKGLWLFFKRFIRCNPFFKGGYDPVPPKK